eukprot:IDg18237t1
MSTADSSSSLSSGRKLHSVAHPVLLPSIHHGVDSYAIAMPPPAARVDRICKDFVTMPPSRTLEHFRDIEFLGPSRCIACLHCLLKPDLSISPVWSWVGTLWLIALPSSLASVAGNLIFRYGKRLDSVEPMSHPVVFRIVSRGTNADCLLETIDVVRREMKANALFPYLIEVVTDGGVFHAPDEKDLMQLVVPRDYRTPGGTLYKARALHYAVENSAVPSNTWVVHLDEETRPTASGIKGIARMVSNSEESGNTRRIGQGGMLYHRNWKAYPFLTLCDMRRTGDDMGHFHLQHRLGFTLFGLHGSFIVCRQDVEAEIGFDLGKRGSITEDAWWVLLAMDRGIRTCWVDGYLDEQSTQSTLDFLKQRRRWYVGLWKVSWHCPAPLRYRIECNTRPFFLRILTNFVISTSVLVYLNGLVANMREHGTSWWMGVLWTVAMLLCVPICYLLEATSVIMACFSSFSSNTEGFHIVEKSPSLDITTDVNAAKSSSEEDDSI